MTTSISCVFCRIASGEIPSQILYQDDQVMAFRDIHPQAPVHIIIIPREHIESIAAIGEGSEVLLMSMIRTANELAHKENVAKSGYRLVTNTGPNAGQEVRHLHWHLLGGKPLGPLVC